MEQSVTARKYPYFIAWILILFGLYLTSLHNYLLFHSLSEIFSVVVACGIFMVAWNSRRFLETNYLLFIGIAYLFIGGLDLTHTLTYKGMGIFQGYETNRATQLWIAARYTESLSLLIAPLVFRRKLRVNLLFLGYGLALLLFLISIFHWNTFPTCFVEGAGLTPFKIMSEYIISLILLGSIALLLKNRNEFDRDVLKWVVWSILLTIASELALTFYADAYGFFNLLGHFLKIVSFYLIYKALIEMGLTRPYDLLFRNLKRTEIAVREEKNKIQNYLDIAGVILLVTGADQKVKLINKKGCEILRYDETEIVGKNWLDTFIPEGIREEVRKTFGLLMKGEMNPVEYFESSVLTKTGEQRMIGWHNAILQDEKGNVLGTLSSGEDITDRKRIEEELTRLASYPQLNPNPVVEVDLAGHVHYANPAAERLFPDLKKAGLHHPWLMGLEKISETLKTDERKTHTRELRVEDHWYEQTVHSVMEGARLRIYSFDITERKRAEEQLHRSEKRYRSYIELTEQLGWTTNADGEVVEDVPSWRKFTGQNEEEVMGWGWLEALHPDDRERVAQIWRNAVATRTSYEVEYRIRRNNGAYRHFLARGVPVVKDDGNIQEWVGTCIDITERKRTEEEVRKSRDELEIRVRERTKEVREQARVLDSFFKFSITPFVILDKDFNFIRVNEAYAQACQREVSEFLGHNHFEFYPSDVKELFERVVGTKKPYQAAARPFSFPDHPEWGTSYWDWTLTPILDGTGEVEYLVFSLENVTERKRAEEAIKGERQRFYDVLEMLPAHLALLTPNYHVPFSNRLFRERFGESNGRCCYEYLFGRSKPCEFCETYTVLKTMAPHEWEWTGPDGRIYDVFDYPFTDTDGSALILEMGIDITERKRAEERLRDSETRLRALSSQLLTAQESERKRIAMELHDGIGQMLTAIKFKAENTLQEQGNVRAKDKSLEAIISIIKETIEEVRRMQMELRPSTLDDLGLLATLGWFSREYQKIYSHIRIEKEITIQEAEVSIPLKTVIYRVTQEALNNIAKHSQTNLVHLSLRRIEDRIELAIEDNGTGFDLKEIFSLKNPQSGLGLSSMRERTELAGGMFTIESTLGKGTIVRASWPL